MKALCFSDPQIGSGKNYGREEGDRLRDQEQAIEQIFAIAIAERCDVIIDGGDTFHGPKVETEEYMAFKRPLQRLRELGGPPVLAVTGNGRHDTAMRDVKAPEILHGDCEVFTTPGLRVVHTPTETVTFALMPHVSIDRLVAAADGGDREQIQRQAVEALLAIARGLREQIDGLAVLVLHFMISGASLPTGLTTDLMGGVVLPVEELAALGFDAVIAGDIHMPQVVHPGIAGLSGPIFYCGSPYPVDFGEADSEHGIYILDVTAAGTTLEFRPIESRPFVTLDVDFPQGDDFSQLLEVYGDWSRIQDAVVRVRYRATEEQNAHIDTKRVRQVLLDLGAHKVMPFEADIIRPNRARVEGVTEQLTELQALNAWIGAEQLEKNESDQLRARAARRLEAVGS